MRVGCQFHIRRVAIVAGVLKDPHAWRVARSALKFDLVVSVSGHTRQKRSRCRRRSLRHTPREQNHERKRCDKPDYPLGSCGHAVGVCDVVGGWLVSCARRGRRSV